ncbi:ADP-ribosylation factor-like protein 13A isoform X2 [Prorops nasuta]|uniref:ADP-ribosylation factor-like protein 13A isoform X2 n=1 Tax=Prorops nasuta TaxID=863751 RepID=UPI0034CE8D7E
MKMGNCIRKVLKRLPAKNDSEKTIVLLIVGLDNAGKTLILNNLQNNPDKNVLPTMGFRIISLRYKGFAVKIYDIGGSNQIRSLWSKYYTDIHGIIYVVDSTDISRLTENRLVFSELVSNENIAGKPLLLLANKQDLNGAIDELDLVENLDVEYVANTMQCPTRVETCTCFQDKIQFKTNVNGIFNGYRWLLDTIIKNYTVLNARVKESQNLNNERVVESAFNNTNTPSKLSIHSNPFKPIKELLAKKANIAVNSAVSHNGIGTDKVVKNVFSRKNKTVPYSTENLIADIEDTTQSNKPNRALFESQNTQTDMIYHITVPCSTKNLIADIEEKAKSIKYKRAAFESQNTQTDIMLDPMRFNTPVHIRPHTAPGRTQIINNKVACIIPGQVPQKY